MKTFYLFIATLIIFIGHLAYAETVTYQGTINGKTATLTLNVQLPSVVVTTVPPPFFDPEFGRMTQPDATIIATLGKITVNYAGHKTKGDLFAFGFNGNSGLEFLIDTEYSSNAVQGLNLVSANGYGDELLNETDVKTSLNSMQNQITDIQFPGQFEVRWEFVCYLSTCFPPTGKADRDGVTQFVKQ
jgi:hypothetical protein